MSEKTRAELKEQIKIMNHNYRVIREMHERGYQYSVGEIKRLQDELDRTRKALGVAVDALKDIDDTRNVVKENLYASYGKSLNSGIVFCWTTPDEIHNALEQITALEQKDVK